MASFVPFNPCKKFPSPKPHTAIRRHVLNRAETATRATDAKPHKGLFNPSREKRVKMKHAKHIPKYRVNVPSEAAMFNARHYTRGQGLARFA